MPGVQSRGWVRDRQVHGNMVRTSRGRKMQQEPEAKLSAILAFDGSSCPISRNFPGLERNSRAPQVPWPLNEIPAFAPKIPAHPLNVRQKSEPVFIRRPPLPPRTRFFLRRRRRRRRGEFRYELAYHDWTQIKICGCTRFNMTRTDDKVKDAFTTKCPYEADEGETFLINMREVVDSRHPGSFKEYAFYNKWDNKVRVRGRGRVRPIPADLPGLSALYWCGGTANVRVMAQGCGSFSRANISAPWRLPMSNSTPMGRSRQGLSDLTFWKICPLPAGEISIGSGKITAPLCDASNSYGIYGSCFPSAPPWRPQLYRCGHLCIV